MTLQPTALVHEAYMRLLGPTDGPEIKWESRGHFFAMAALAMRRISAVPGIAGASRLTVGPDPESVPFVVLQV